MIKKRLLAIITLVCLTISCSSDDDPRDNYPQNKDITFSITSSDDNRLSEIEYTIEGDGVNILEASYSESHLPNAKSYLSQSIPYSTSLGIHYKDNSGGGVGIPFNPYVIKLEIKVDSKVVAEKETTINESGTVEFLNFIFY
ncbi:hypothetical protein [Aureibaculum luteum]|uniref:hypothetical protein n=1 Tax=Aureibaculum luteum TaxID=1548456 RepID=UPI000E52DCA8|nr:hypothetical protein [Aureibaculum luteum]